MTPKTHRPRTTRSPNHHRANPSTAQNGATQATPTSIVPTWIGTAIARNASPTATQAKRCHGSSSRQRATTTAAAVQTRAIRTVGAHPLVEILVQQAVGRGEEEERIDRHDEQVFPAAAPPPGRQQAGGEEKPEDNDQKEEGRGLLFGVVVPGEPGPVQPLDAEEGDRSQCRPARPQPGQPDRGGGQNGEVEEKANVLVLFANEQQWGQQTAGQCQQGDGGRVVSRRQQGRQRHQDGQEGAAFPPRQEGIETEGRVGGQVQRDDAGRGADFAEDAALLQMATESGQTEAGADQDADGDAAEFADPVVVEGVLEEEGGGEDEQNHGEPPQPSPDPPLQVAGRRGRPRRLRPRRRRRTFRRRQRRRSHTLGGRHGDGFLHHFQGRRRRVFKPAQPPLQPLDAFEEFTDPP